MSLELTVRAQLPGSRWDGGAGARGAEAGQVEAAAWPRWEPRVDIRHGQGPSSVNMDSVAVTCPSLFCILGIQ